MVVILNLFN